MSPSLYYVLAAGLGLLLGWRGIANKIVAAISGAVFVGGYVTYLAYLKMWSQYTESSSWFRWIPLIGQASDAMAVTQILSVVAIQFIISALIYGGIALVAYWIGERIGEQD